MTLTIKRLQESDQIQIGGLFEPTTINARWRAFGCGSNAPTNLADFATQWGDYYTFRPGTAATALPSVPGAPYVDGATGKPADAITALATQVGYELMNWNISRNPGSNSVWDVNAEMQLVVDIPNRGHTLVTRTTRQRAAQAWRINPWANGNPDPQTFWTDAAGVVTPLASCNDVSGDRCDVWGQPLTVMIDQYVMTVSFVIRAPYIDADQTGNQSNTWNYWTRGKGAASLNSRNDAVWNGWPAYSLVIEGIEITQIGMTTFHRVDVTMVHDEWWHLEQVPVTFNGAIPPVVSACGGKILQQEECLWLNPFCTVSVFGGSADALINNTPYSGQSYLNTATLVDGLPFGGS